jgi:hypothetical protein
VSKAIDRTSTKFNCFVVWIEIVKYVEMENVGGCKEMVIWGLEGEDGWWSQDAQVEQHLVIEARSCDRAIGVGSSPP